MFDEGDAPRWATGDFWAPEIHRMPDGSFNVYHTARDAAGLLSIGCATSSSPTGPFKALAEPLARDSEGHGMYLDSHYFYDNVTSTGYLVWKHGSVTPPAETHTWLYMQPLDASGAKNASFEPIIHKSDQFTKTGSGQIQEKLRKEAFCVGTRLVGERRVILRNNLSSWEAGVVEAPWIVRVSGFYYLFYSAAHCCDGSGAPKNALFWRATIILPRQACRDKHFKGNKR